MENIFVVLSVLMM